MSTGSELSRWEPISEEQIWDKINEAQLHMDYRQQRLWECISILPEKWAQEPYGAEGNGFWVVAIIGRIVLWYNDIEEGFNLSKYETYGQIQDYWCDQDNLVEAVQRLVWLVDEGHWAAQASGPFNIR